MSEIQANVNMHERAVLLGMRERRWMSYLGDSWSGGHQRRTYNEPYNPDLDGDDPHSIGFVD